MTLEMASPIRAAVEEAAKCAWVCRLLSRERERFLRPMKKWETLATIVRSVTCLSADPRVMPWNFPSGRYFDCSTVTDGGKRCPIEARIECSAMRARIEAFFGAPDFQRA